MVFSSPTFIFLFFPAVFLLAFLLRRSIKWSNAVLLVFSLLFYAWGEPVYVLLMALTTLICYICALGIKKAPKSAGGDKRGRFFCTLAVIWGIGTLVIFKYTGFLVSSFNSVTGLSIPVPDIALPIGISFFTFQAISYVLDVKRGNAEAATSFLDVLLYISLFPQLIAGPIVRYQDVAEQIRQRHITLNDTALGLRRFCFGMAKKVLIANTLAYTADRVYALTEAELNAPIAWLGAICYLMQIYFDFSGYSDMAIGLGRAFGFTFRENFMYPYCADSMQDFWRRWHISLSTWFKEYVYIPLGGNRRGRLRTGVNKLTVFLLTGLWHGASWNFALWGLYHGLFLMLESYGLLRPKRWHRALRHIYTVLAVTVGFVLFRADTLSGAWLMIAKMFTGWQFAPLFNARLSLLLSPICIVALIVSVFACMPAANSIANRFTVYRPKLGYAVYCAALLLFIACIACLSTASYNPFIYFRF